MQKYTLLLYKANIYPSFFRKKCGERRKMLNENGMVAKKNETVSGRKVDGGKGAHYYTRMRRMRERASAYVSEYAYECASGCA